MFIYTKLDVFLFMHLMYLSEPSKTIIQIFV